MISRKKCFFRNKRLCLMKLSSKFTSKFDIYVWNKKNHVNIPRPEHLLLKIQSGLDFKAKKTFRVFLFQIYNKF